MYVSPLARRSIDFDLPQDDNYPLPPSKNIVRTNVRVAYGGLEYHRDKIGTAVYAFVASIGFQVMIMMVNKRISTCHSYRIENRAPFYSSPRDPNNFIFLSFCKMKNYVALGIRNNLAAFPRARIRRTLYIRSSEHREQVPPPPHSAPINPRTDRFRPPQSPGEDGTAVAYENRAETSRTIAVCRRELFLCFLLRTLARSSRSAPPR